MNDVIDQASGIPRQWAGLNRHLIARLYEVDARGVEVHGAASVFAPITDASFDATLAWQSPFENVGPEQRLPALMAMVQTGQLGAFIAAIQARGFANETGSFSKGIADSLTNAATDLEGRSSLTRLNSRQVFAGMPPVKISAVMHFRAWSNPSEEVERPYKRLLEMALPKRLAEDSTFIEAIKNAPSNGGELLRTLFPSEAPSFVGLSYASERYGPLVLEHVSHQVDVPRDSNGRPIFRSVNIELSSLTALDRSDVARIFLR